MIDRNDEDLLNRELDGELAPEEVAALRGLVATRAEARDYQDALRMLAHILGSVGMENPPEDLKAEIMNRVREKQKSSHRRHVRIETLGYALLRPVVLRYALAFAAGLALGTLVTALAVRPSFHAGLEGSHASATMLRDRLKGLENVDRRVLDAGGIHGTATTRAGEDLVLAEIQIDAPRAVDMVVEFDSNVLSPVGFERRAAPGGSEVILASDHLRLTHTGEGSYDLLFDVKKRIPSQLRLQLKGEDVELERTLETRREGS